MFGNCELDSIRAAINDEMKEIKHWTEWHHQATTTTVLPSGATIDNDRGAEQGDAFGSLQACLVLASHRPQWATSAPTANTLADTPAETATVPLACGQRYNHLRPRDHHGS